MIFIYILVTVLALILIRASMITSLMVIEKEITINKPLEEVFNYVLFLKHHKQFNKWTMTDPEVQIEYTGTDGQVGFHSHWKSKIKNVGEGEQSITAIENNHKISYALKFIKPFEGTASAYISTSAINKGATKVCWGFSGPRQFTAKVMQVLLNLEKMLGKDLEKSLLNLKALLEK